MKGPYIIVCRAHSGGRVLSNAFIRNGIQMGNVRKNTNDTMFFAVRRNASIRKLIEVSFDYPKMSDSDKKQYQKIMRDTVFEFIDQEIDNPNKPFGWKFGETLFTSQILMETFPSAKVIHLIRDGRDVMLSRIPSRFEKKIEETFNKLIIFGSKNVTHFLDKPFDERLLSQNRNEIEIQHWVTCVKFGLTCRKYSDQYLEIKYEDLCCEPIPTLSKIFSFIDVPFKRTCRWWAKKNVSSDRIHKWKDLSDEEMKLPLNIARETLSTLNYL